MPPFTDLGAIREPSSRPIGRRRKHHASCGAEPDHGIAAMLASRQHAATRLGYSSKWNQRRAPRCASDGKLRPVEVAGWATITDEVVLDDGPVRRAGPNVGTEPPKTVPVRVTVWVTDARSWSVLSRPDAT